MADYSANATELPTPKSGTSPIAPVQVESGLTKALTTVGSIFAKGVAASAEDEAKKRKANIVANFVRVETQINEAVATGQMTPAQASTRSKANFNQYAAGYSEYIGDFEQAAKALRGFTETGEVHAKLEQERNVRNADIEEARKMGLTFVPGMSVQAENDQIAAAKASKIANDRLEQIYKANAEARAQGTYDAGVAEREAKTTSTLLINDIASKNLQAFQSFSATLGEQVRSRAMSPEQAQVALAERFGNISAAIQSAARTNPELAAPYRSLFSDMNEVAKKLIDPKSAAENLENELKVIQTRMKLVAMSHPRLAATIVANQLLPNNPGLALASTPEAVNAINVLSATPTGSTEFVPTVVGNPDTESDVLKMLKGGLNSLKTDNVSDKEVANIQASNSVNQILKQTGEYLNKGATPDKLKGLANFFASPEYASFVTSGKIDKEAAGAAKKTFQLLYEPTIMRGVQQKFNEALSQGGSRPGRPQADPIKIAEAIDVQFSGSGIVFGLKPTRNLNTDEQQSRVSVLRDLKIAQQAINQIIHIGAHLEGSTDYAKYWEEKKHVFLPQIYPDPKRLKEGDVIDGYKYIGGAYNDPRSWQPAQGGN